MMTFKLESLSDMYMDIEEQTENIQKAISPRTSTAIKVDWEYFLRLDSLGMVRMIVAREEGHMIGFIGFILDTNPHHMTIQATASVLYVHPEKRKFGTASKIIRKAEETLREEGVHLMVCAAVPEIDYSMILTRSGFRVGDTLYIKEL